MGSHTKKKKINRIVSSPVVVDMIATLNLYLFVDGVDLLMIVAVVEQLFAVAIAVVVSR